MFALPNLISHMSSVARARSPYSQKPITFNERPERHWLEILNPYLYQKFQNSKTLPKGCVELSRTTSRNYGNQSEDEKIEPLKERTMISPEVRLRNDVFWKSKVHVIDAQWNWPTVLDHINLTITLLSRSLTFDYKFILIITLQIIIQLIY